MEKYITLWMKNIVGLGFMALQSTLPFFPSMFWINSFSFIYVDNWPLYVRKPCISEVYISLEFILGLADIFILTLGIWSIKQKILTDINWEQMKTFTIWNQVVIFWEISYIFKNHYESHQTTKFLWQ